MKLTRKPFPSGSYLSSFFSIKPFDIMVMTRPKERVGMFSKFKELFDFTPEPNHSDAKEDLYKELEQFLEKGE